MASERRYCQFCGTQIWSIDHGSHVCPTQRLEGIFVSAAVVEQVRAWIEDCDKGRDATGAEYVEFWRGRKGAFQDVLALLDEAGR